MISPLQTGQIADRIASSVRQAGGTNQRLPAELIARGELPPVPEPVTPPILRDDKAAVNRLFQGTDLLMDETASMFPRARAKVTVDDSVPGVLKPLYRNQGGYNNILLEALERMVEINRQLQRQNRELHARLVSIQGWMEGAAQTSLLDHDWMLAVENRLRGITDERLERLEAKVAGLMGETGSAQPTEREAGGL